jgi:iron complex transport system ATP-binding protein
VSAPVLEVRDLGLTVEGRALLQGVSFALEPGQALAVVGPNGAGKTTLLRCLLHIHERWTGQIRVGGQPLRELRPRQRARDLSYVPQLDGRSLPFRVRELVSMARYAYQEPFAGQSPADRRAVDHALEITGLAPLAGRSMATLSGGERQQAFIAAALAQSAGVLLLDEPTAFLDYRHQVRVHAILASIRQETRTTICIVTHDLNEAAAVADQALALRDGRVVFAGGCDDLLDPAVLRDIYGVEFALVERGAGLPPIVAPAGEGTVLSPLPHQGGSEPESERGSEPESERGSELEPETGRASTPETEGASSSARPPRGSP